MKIGQFANYEFWVAKYGGEMFSRIVRENKRTQLSNSRRHKWAVTYVRELGDQDMLGMDTFVGFRLLEENGFWKSCVKGNA